MTHSTTVVLLFAIANGVALITRSIRIPYTVALVLIGLGLGWTGILVPPHLTQELLYTVFLPGLLFEAAFHIDARGFWEDRSAILLLAVPGVAVAIGLTSVALVWASRAFGSGPAFSYGPMLAFASLISATDPIAVVALFKTLGAPARLGLLIDAESLVNDGTAAVFYAIAVAFAGGARLSVADAGVRFLAVVGFGVATGAAVGLIVSLVIVRIRDPVIEIALTTIAAYGSFAFAEQLGVSGVLATVTAGMFCGNYGAPRGMNETTRVAVESFWTCVAFALNSIVFLLMGFQVHLAPLLAAFEPVIFAYAVVMAVRAVVVFLVATTAGNRRISWRWGLVLSWGGLRGALSMVLALALPADFPERELVTRLTFGVVTLSILFNGLTIGPLIRALGLARSPNAITR